MELFMTNEMIKLKLEDLGFNEEFDLQWKSLALTDSSVARVIAEHKETYRVKNAEGEYLAKITGKQLFHAQKREDYPAVGDWVVITELESDRAVIHAILPRKTILQKKYNDTQEIQVIATNIDVSFIIESLDRDYNLNRFERYFVLANEGGIKPVIILNKTDLVSETELRQHIEQIKDRFPGIDIISTSTITDLGLDELVHYISRGKTYCFLGSSGVGKSSLINKLLKNNAIKTREISDSTGKGKHTTTAREMYFLEPGGIVIDNPGSREVGIADASAGLINVFDAIISLAKECKFTDCTHTNEPGCAVLKAMELKQLDNGKYQNYMKLKKENDFYEMSNLEKRNKDRKFGKFKKKVLKDLDKY